MNQMTISFKTKTGMTNIRHNNRELSEEEFKSNEHKHINRALLSILAVLLILIVVVLTFLLLAR